MSVEIAPYYFSKKKRAFDLSFAIFLSVLLTPILLLLCIVILCTAGRPIFFLQKRVGKNKIPFQIIKLRTMYHNAHKDQRKYWKQNEAPFPTFKLSNDPRFVGIGRWLSKTGLDELPQLINIIRGEMSFIGPRPLPIDEAKKLSGSWDFRYQVKPGIISLWALSDKRHKSLKHWQELEKKTLLIFSTVQDFKILYQASEILLNFLVKHVRS